MAKILVIDAQPCIRELFLVELLDEGYLVETTGDAESIQERIRSFKPQLVLLDLYMNGQDRWDILLDIKERDPNLPVLIVTGLDRFRENPRSYLADGYCLKSMYLDELKRKITELLQSQTIFPNKGESKAMFYKLRVEHQY
jgi:DNA-binding NtrC family response regulator